MTITGRDKEFRLPKISHLDYTTINMDQVMIHLFPRLRYGGYPSLRPARNYDLTVDEFVAEIVENPKWFDGFADNEDVVHKWVETELMDMVNRGRANQAVASPRPLHGNTYKFRNTRHTRPRGVADHIYWMLFYAHNGQAARDRLKNFFFEGVDLITDKYDPLVVVDVETQALLWFGEKQVLQDRKDDKFKLPQFRPLLPGHADILADDVLRLLAYQSHIPRSVLVDYLKTLFAFHMALYHLRLLKILPLILQDCAQGPAALDEKPLASPAQVSPSRYQIGLVVDMGDPNNVHMRSLAEHSAELHYRRIPEYVRAHFVIKKLDELADYLTLRTGKITSPEGDIFTVAHLLELLGDAYKSEREAYFKARLANLVEQTDLDPEVRRITEIGLSDLEAFVEILSTSRGKKIRSQLVKCLDSLLQKNRTTGLLKQSSVANSSRHYSMSSQLLETLLQIAVLTSAGGSAFITREIRVDELITFLRERYRLYIDQLPEEDGFSEPSIIDRQALRGNVDAFKRRLREIGFFQDLSDAYIAQTVTPRYSVQPI